MRYFGFFILLVLVCIYGCTSEIDKSGRGNNEVVLDFSERSVQRAYELKAAFTQDSLADLLASPDPTQRLIALRAFADWKSNESLDEILLMLADPVRDIRLEAAYTLGQIGDAHAVASLLDLFKMTDSLEVDQELLGIALEAVGKIGEAAYLGALATISTYSEQDTDLLEGQALGIYRYLLRGIERQEGFDKMIEFLSQSTSSDFLRTTAAQYFVKSKLALSPSQTKELLDLSKREVNIGIRRNLWVLLAKSQSPEVLDLLKSAYRASSSRLDKLVILDALENYSYSQIADIAQEELVSSDQRIATEAADLFVKTGSGANGRTFLQESFKEWPWYVKAKLQSAVNKHMRSPEALRKINVDLLYKSINEATDRDQKIAFLEALETYPLGANRIIRYFEGDEDPRVRATCASLIHSFVSENRIRIGETIRTFVIQLLSSGDVAQISMAAQMLLSNEELLESVDVAQINEVVMNLDLPMQAEAYTSLQSVLDKKNGRQTSGQLVYESIKLPPIDWTLLERYPRAVIRTNKGNIELELDYHNAPFSVMNFLTLAERDYYDMKQFHRVVTNFVDQAGCDRGDGYGALNYTIPTETPHMHYDEAGYIGMASAGRNTESSQWFITQAPTLHLDGRYTIFGKVIRGLEVLERLDENDLIQSVDLIENNSTNEIDENNNTDDLS